jgi:hypothetical protein
MSGQVQGAGSAARTGAASTQKRREAAMRRVLKVVIAVSFARRIVEAADLIRKL